MPAVETPLVHGERRDDGVVVLTLDHPKVNALSQALLDELRAHIDGLRHQIDTGDTEPPGALVVTGGSRIFAAGAEITEFGGPAEAASVAASFRAALDAVGILPAGDHRRHQRVRVRGWVRAGPGL